MILCSDVWNHILEYASILPKYTLVCTTFGDISHRIYRSSIDRIRQKYVIYPSYEVSLNKAALDNEWEEFLMLHFVLSKQSNISFASRICILFDRVDILRKINPKHLFLMWQTRHPHRFKETRRMLYHNQDKGLEFIHDDMLEYIRKMEHIPRKFQGFTWTRIMCSKQQVEYWISLGSFTMDDLAACGCKPNHNFIQAIACSDLGLLLKTTSFADIRKILSGADILTPEIIRMRKQIAMLLDPSF